MHGIHDVFPADDVDEEDQISFKKLLKVVEEGGSMGTPEGLPWVHLRWRGKDDATGGAKEGVSIGNPH